MKNSSMIKLKSLFAALSVALLLAASDARAAFTYSVSPATITTTFGTGSTSTYTVSAAFPTPTTSSVLAGPQIINLVQTTQFTTRTPPATDTTSFPISLVVTINNTTDGSGSFTVAGTIGVQRSDTGGGVSSFTLTSILPTSLTLGGFTYTLAAPTYTAPTINATTANGGISISITETSVPGVPEPASLVMMGTSALALGGLAVIRRRRQS